SARAGGQIAESSRHRRSSPADSAFFRQRARRRRRSRASTRPTHRRVLRQRRGPRMPTDSGGEAAARLRRHAVESCQHDRGEGACAVSMCSPVACVLKNRGQMGSLDSYLPIFFMIVLGIAFAGLSFGASKLLAPQRPTSPKEAPYECGIVPDHEPANRFPVRFYLIAMIFVVVDIEIIFIFPWAVISQSLGRFGLVEIIVFAASVFVPLVYLVANGALDWGPLKRVRPIQPDSSRTSSSTVRRIGPSSGEAA